MNDAVIQDLCEIIRTTLQSRGQVKGSTLGASIRACYPDLDLKREFGGLRNFMDTYYRAGITRTLVPGGDDVYSLAGDGEAPTRGSQAREIEPTPWDAFNNPAITDRLAVVSTTGELLLHGAESPVPEGSVPLDKLTAEDYREMASRFLTQVPEASRWEFERALAHENFWPRWAEVLRQHQTEPVYRQWPAWRVSEIMRLFADRLDTAGVSRQIVEKAAVHLTRSREETLAARRKLAVATRRAGVPPRHRATSERCFPKEDRSRVAQTSLQSLIHAAVDRMTDDELRHLWLPAGALIDAVNEPRS